ncbi:MAG: hypothetical protein IJ578_07375 [Bacteroidales bacterium]|nr:hypothetical protein [Bacteroidales bacterium]
MAVVALSLMGTGAFAQSSIGIFNSARSFASKVDGADKTESTAASIDFGVLDRNASDAIRYHQSVLKFTAAYIF